MPFRSLRLQRDFRVRKKDKNVALQHIEDLHGKFQERGVHRWWFVRHFLLIMCPLSSGIVYSKPTCFCSSENYGWLFSMTFSGHLLIQSIRSPQDIQMLKFGQIVDLDLIERSAPNKYVQDLTWDRYMMSPNSLLDAGLKHLWSMIHDDSWWFNMIHVASDSMVWLS